MRMRIGGFPEHINIPWYDTVARLQSEDEKVEWIDCPGGTGQMIQRLEDKEIDLAIMLTEGAVARITNEDTFRILGVYVSTPLIWGIRTAALSLALTMDELAGGRYGISRYGSGSHLMAFVDAHQRGWTEAPKICSPCRGM